MNRLIVVLLAAVVVFSACEKLDLKRDNPLDEYYYANSIDGVYIRYSEYKVRRDGNGDGIINKGESVQIDVQLKNNGTSNAQGVKAKFSTASEYVSNFSPLTAVDYGDISSGLTKWANNINNTAFKFTVSEEAPSGTTIPVKIEIEDQYGNQWVDSLTLKVESTGVRVRYNECKVRRDGNGDGIINKGESVQIDVQLKNVGTSNAQGIKAKFSTASEYVSNFSPLTAVDYGDISSGLTKWANNINNTAFKFTVSEEVPSGTTIPVKIEIEDQYGNQWVDSLTLKVESTGARVRYNEYKVRRDGNGNGIINKGESVQIDVQLKNVGTSNAQGVKAKFSTASEYVLDFSPLTAVDYGDISSGLTKWANNINNTAFKFTVLEEAPVGTTIPIKIDIEDEYGNEWASEFVLNVQ